MRRCLLVCLPLILGAALGAGTAPAESAAPDPDRVVQACLSACAALQDYTCLFSRRERVGDTIKEQKAVAMKFRKPFSVYLKWTAGKERGSEAIWEKGKRDDQLRVHLGGWLSFVDVTIDPAGKQAMKTNRHPISEIGLVRLTEKLLGELQKARAAGEGTIEFKGDKEREGRPCWVFRGTFPRDKGYYCGEALVWIDRELNLPIFVTVSGWDGDFWEEYGFDDLRLNPGLKDIDFDPENSAYGF